MWLMILCAQMSILQDSQLYHGLKFRMVQCAKSFKLVMLFTLQNKTKEEHLNTLTSVKWSFNVFSHTLR